MYFESRLAINNNTQKKQILKKDHIILILFTDLTKYLTQFLFTYEHFDSVVC